MSRKPAINTHLVCPTCGWGVTMHRPIKGRPTCSHLGTRRAGNTATFMIEVKNAPKNRTEGMLMLKAVAS